MLYCDKLHVMSVHDSRVLESPEQSIYRSHRFPTIPLLAQTQILFEREGGLTECYVPTELINHEEVPVKEEWASSIAAQMKRVAEKNGGSGQKTPIQLGWIEGEQQFRIIDGFHRDAALMMNGATEIFSTVESTDWNSLYDSRIFTAKDHAHVRFSRVVKWIQEVWTHSGLSEQLSVEQAILLYRFESTGKRLGLSQESADAAKQWVDIKQTQWALSAMTIHSYLQTAERVDPALVLATREKRDGKILEAPTQQIIKMFSDNLPNDFPLQHLVLGTAKAHNLGGPQVKAICKLVKDKDPEEAQAIIDNLDMSNLEPEYGETKNKQLRRASDPRFKGADVLKAALTEIERVNARVKASIDRDEEVDGQMQAKLTETLNRVNKLQRELGVLTVNITNLKKKDEKNEAMPVVTMATVERAYKRHKTDTVNNIGRTPEPRNRTSNVVIDLPGYGKFYAEDWGSLEPHLRFGLTLEHPDVNQKSIKSEKDFYSKLLDLSGIMPEAELPQDPKAFANLLKPLLARLTTLSPKEIGNVIGRDQTSKRIVVTKAGKDYLRDVANNALLAVDDSKRE